MGVHSYRSSSYVFGCLGLKLQTTTMTRPNLKLHRDQTPNLPLKSFIFIGTSEQKGNEETKTLTLPETNMAHENGCLED